MNDLNFTDKFRCGTQGGVEQRYSYYDDGTGVRGLLPKLRELWGTLRAALTKHFKKNP